MTEKTLYDLEAGGQVCIMMYGTPRFIRKIKRTTKTQIILEDDSRWRKEDGKEYGSRGDCAWYNKSNKKIKIVTDVDVVSVRKRFLLLEILDNITSISNHLKDKKKLALNIIKFERALEMTKELKKIFDMDINEE